MSPGVLRQVAIAGKGGLIMPPNFADLKHIGHLQTIVRIRVSGQINK